MADAASAAAIARLESRLRPLDQDGRPSVSPANPAMCVIQLQRIVSRAVVWMGALINSALSALPRGSRLRSRPAI